MQALVFIDSHFNHDSSFIVSVLVNIGHSGEMKNHSGIESGEELAVHEFSWVFRRCFSGLNNYDWPGAL